MQEPPSDKYNWVTAMRTLWLQRGIKLEPGVPLTEIEATELNVGIQFPSDMKELYQVVNGFKDSDMDLSSMISIWSIERIREEHLASPDKNFVGFCDYLINSHSIGFFKDRSGIYKSYDEFNPIAYSFTEVIEFINNDDDIIL